MHSLSSLFSLGFFLKRSKVAFFKSKPPPNPIYSNPHRLLTFAKN